MNQAWNFYALELRTGFGELGWNKVSVALAEFDDTVRLQLEQAPHHVLDLRAASKRLIELFREHKLDIPQIGVDPAVTAVASRLAMEVVAQHTQRMDALMHDLRALIEGQILHIGPAGVLGVGLALVVVGAVGYVLWDASTRAQIGMDPYGDYDGDGIPNRDDEHPRNPNKGFFTRWWQEVNQIAAFAPLTQPRVRDALSGFELALTVFIGAKGVRALELQAPRAKPVRVLLRV